MWRKVPKKELSDVGKGKLRGSCSFMKKQVIETVIDNMTEATKHNHVNWLMSTPGRSLCTEINPKK